MEKQSINPIDYYSNILLLGSCFAENVSDKFNYFKFNNLSNPFGILFHPLAIEEFIIKAINEHRYTEQDIFELNERWHSFDAHSRLSDMSKEQLIENLNAAIDVAHKEIKSASHFIITLGTAWIYRYIASDLIVANCHKMPQKKFTKELLSIDEISASLLSIVALIRDVNPNSVFIFTVSPVRHLKDGFVENTRSKSHLISAVHTAVDPRQRVHYFPSYELVMDELRDYRFYNEDMIHLSKTAINYIWAKFEATWISEGAINTMSDVDEVQKGLLHKPFNSKSEAHQQFLQNLEVKKTRLQQEYPRINF